MFRTSVVPLQERSYAVCCNLACLDTSCCYEGEGTTASSSVVGDSLLWKNTKKNDTKNKISEMMNKNIPHRSPFVTIFVCSP